MLFLIPKIQRHKENMSFGVSADQIIDWVGIISLVHLLF